MFSSKTANSCSTWTRYYLATIGYVYAIAVDPMNSAIVYAGGNPSVYRTSNGGTNWIDVSSGLTDVVMDIAIDPFTSTTLYAATRDGVFKTTNSGGLWANTGCTEATSLIPDPLIQGMIYCGTANGVYKSTNGGGDWYSMNDGLMDTNVTCIGIDPDEFLFVGTAGNGLYRWHLNTGSLESRSYTAQSTACRIDPNPGSGKATITYHLNRVGHFRISLYNASGQLVRIVHEAEQLPGIYRTALFMSDTPPGIYFVRLETYDDVSVTKFVHCK
ncbi:T9SS type A sorting domain-containing protein [candidate division WOR-3 bacterium]|nr:T9SS type A sorting domain-containing protein [candidate division WOR-3 bacterium]